MTCRDWKSTLLPARFRGVTFWVENDAKSGGRRIQVHQFPMRDRPFNEDLGEEARKFRVSAYVFGDDVEAQAEALFSACTRRGAGALQLPMQPSISAKCLSVERTFNADKLGVIEFSLEFVQDFGVAGGPFSLPVLGRVVEVAAGTAMAALAGAFARQGWSKSVSAARELAAAHIAEVADVLNGVLGSLSFAGNMSDAVREVSGMVRNAGRLVASDAGAGSLAESMTKVVTDIRENAADQSDAARRLISASTDIQDAVKASSIARSAVEGERLTGAVSWLARGALLGQASAAAVNTDWGSREEAVDIRARLGDAMDAARDGLNDEDALAALLDVQGAAAKALAEMIASKKPVVTVSANETLPADVWAYRLYDDASRSEELIRRNRVAHPSYMPAEFEAVAS